MKAGNKYEKGKEKEKKDLDSVTDSLPVSQKCISSAEVLFFLFNETSICQCRCLWHREDRRLLEMPSPLKGSHILGRGKKGSEILQERRGMGEMLSDVNFNVEILITVCAHNPCCCWVAFFSNN